MSPLFNAVGASALDLTSREGDDQFNVSDGTIVMKVPLCTLQSAGEESVSPHLSPERVEQN